MTTIPELQARSIGRALNDRVLTVEFDRRPTQEEMNETLRRLRTKPQEDERK